MAENFKYSWNLSLCYNGFILILIGKVPGVAWRNHRMFGKGYRSAMVRDIVYYRNGPRGIYEIPMMNFQ